MRSSDMEVGRRYVIPGSREPEVTVLETPPELRRKGRVVVRFETGVSTGKVKDIPSRTILRPVDGPAPQRRMRRPRRRLIQIDRDPRVGDTVLLDDTGELEWRVEAIDNAARRATVKSVILSRPQTKIAGFDQLQIRPLEVLDPGDEQPSPKPPHQRPADPAAPSLAPEKPRRQLDELMEDIVFSQNCLAEYHRRLAARVKRKAISEHLREEIRGRGYTIIHHPLLERDEFGRIGVEGRFEFVLPRRPSADDPLTVKRLIFLSGRSRSPKRRRPRRRR